MLQIKILYTTPRKFRLFSYLIRVLTRVQNQDFKNTPSHMALVFYDNLVLEARAGGVRLTYLSHFAKHNKLINVFKAQAKVNFYNILDEYYGKPYDKSAVIYYGLFLIRKKIFRRRLPDMYNWQNKDRFYCSELIEAIGFNDLNSLSPNGQMIKLFERLELDSK